MGRQYTEEEMIEKFGFVPGLDDYDYYGENDYKEKGYYEEDESIDWDKEIIIPTHEKIRNNIVEEKGRGRIRNRNDVYKNITTGLVMGYVNDRKDGDEMYKYLYEKDIDKRLEELKNEGIKKLPSKKRIIKDFMQIYEQLGVDYIDICSTKENGLCYLIKQSFEGKYFTTIPLFKWKELMNHTNKEILRLFAVISMNKKISENDYVLMTREYLCKCMDIEVNEGNMNYIGSMCNVLFKLGHIDIEVEDVVEFIDGKRVPKTYNWFRLTTQKEWEEKSKKKKRKRKNS